MKRIALAPSHVTQQKTYPRWLERRGFAPTILKPGQSLEGFDALVLCGGADVGAEPERDANETAWFREAYGKIPVLGICRGMQLSNVILGGTLWKDLSPERGGIKHTSNRVEGSPKSSAPSSFHAVIETEDIKKDFGASMLKMQHLNEQAVDKLMNLVDEAPTGRVMELISLAQKNLNENALNLKKFDVKYFTVNSRHHQGVKILAEDLQPLAYCPIDNLVEMAKSKSTNALFVQWHPEREDVWDTRAETIVSEWLASATQK